MVLGSLLAFLGLLSEAGPSMGILGRPAQDPARQWQKAASLCPGRDMPGGS